MEISKNVNSATGKWLNLAFGGVGKVVIFALGLIAAKGLDLFYDIYTTPTLDIIVSKPVPIWNIGIANNISLDSINSNVDCQNLYFHSIVITNSGISRLDSSQYLPLVFSTSKKDAVKSLNVTASDSLPCRHTESDSGFQIEPIGWDPDLRLNISVITNDSALLSFKETRRSKKYARVRFSDLKRSSISEGWIVSVLVGWALVVIVTMMVALGLVIYDREEPHPKKVKMALFVLVFPPLLFVAIGLFCRLFWSMSVFSVIDSLLN